MLIRHKEVLTAGDMKMSIVTLKSNAVLGLTLIVN